MLEFQNAAFLNLYEEDGLLIIAKGLGEELLVEKLLKVYSDSGNLVLVVGATANDEAFYMERSKEAEVEMKLITSEIAANDRTDVYLKGGILFITSRILVVDLLKSIIPTHLITGIIVLNAHKVLDSSAEAFIVRLYREKNKTGFIKAISSNPDAFTRGFCRVEHVMRNLFVRKLFLWPRFQATVQSSLEAHKAEGVEIQVHLTDSMKDIHSALLDLIVSCIRDLKKNNASLDLDEVTADNANSKSFDKLVKFQLEPIWHQLGSVTKRLINDLRELRTLLNNLTQYDCVTFYKLIQSLSTAEMAMRNPGWIFLPAFAIVLEKSKQRVYGSSKRDQNVAEKSKPAKLVLEENPKWSALKQVLKEISDEIDRSKLPAEASYIMIVASDIRTCDQLKEVLCKGDRQTLLDLHDKYQNSSKQSEKSKSNKRRKKEESDSDSGVITLTQLLGGSKSKHVDVKIILEPLSGPGGKAAVQKSLLQHKPAYVIMYDIDVTFIRQLEVYRASYPEIPLFIHFLIFENSSEEQRYLNGLRREKQAFEMLIQQKGEMVIPEEREGKGDLVRDSRKASETVNASNSSRRGGYEEPSSIQQKVIVDMREFRSELPSLIHRRGIDIEPVTLEVGDYILTPDICVERKSVTDLIGSLYSGRLYTQVTAMCRFYKKPVLLIEFDLGKSFALRGSNDVSNEISSNDYVSKLLLLTLHFPKLQILWCSSPFATAEMFEELKSGKEQPNVLEAQKITETVTTELGIDSNVEKYNSAPKDFLMLMPGVDTKNLRVIMNKCQSLVHLANDWSEDQINQLLGNSANAKNLYQGLHQPLEKLGVANNSGKFKGRDGKRPWKKRY
ncbi:DNA repair endonuclease XPF [Chamberlinius hualienensis]